MFFPFLFDGGQVIGDSSAFECRVVRFESEDSVPEGRLDLSDGFSEHVAGGDFHRAFHMQFDFRFCFAEEMFPVGGLFKNGPFLISEPDTFLRDIGELKNQDGIRFRKRIVCQRERRQSLEAVCVPDLETFPLHSSIVQSGA